MPLAELTHLWIEQPLMPSAQRLLPPHLTLVQAPAAPAYDQLASVQAAVVGTALRYNARLLDSAPRLRIIARIGIGLDTIDIEAATRRGILVCNTPDGPTESTAEHAVAMLLALAKRLKEGNASLAAGEFPSSRQLTGSEVRGKTLGIIGFGRIGRRVAEICRAGLQMEVLAYSRSLTDEQAARLGVRRAALERVIAEADFLTLHLPLTAETRGLISSERLQLMKEGSYLLNVSRGGLVDSAALLRALDSGRLAGAALDVFDPEPPPSDSPLRNHPRVIATPHIASSTREGRSRMEEMAVAQVLAFFRGEPLPLAVNPEALL